MLRFVLAAILFLAVSSDEVFERAEPDYAWSFPRDHWAHEGYRTEWWYFTGHLASKDDPGRRFGYQFTFFRIGLMREEPELDSAWASSSLILAHAAVSDLASERHLFSEVLYREMPLLANFGEIPAPDGGRIGWSRGPAGTEALWTLDWNGAGFDFAAADQERGFGFTLRTRPVKPLVFQGPNGFSRKGAEEGAASLYYSFTRLATTGELEVGGERFSVSGESWMDKEFSSSQLSEGQVGWDWFSLQLEDGREVMLYVMRAEDGSVDYARGTLVGESGSARYLTGADFQVEAREHWTSPETGARYPVRWRLAIEGETFLVNALFPDQENRSRLPGGVYYWEGAVSVAGPYGETRGRGFVELTGYGEGNRPPV